MSTPSSPGERVVAVCALLGAAKHCREIAAGADEWRSVTRTWLDDVAERMEDAASLLRDSAGEGMLGEGAQAWLCEWSRPGGELQVGRPYLSRREAEAELRYVVARGSERTVRIVALYRSDASPTSSESEPAGGGVE